ncbi:MAG: neuraminidase [Candidatus Lokiarchaeota archaeon]|nr:neuraminidase [Candidatus Lokiarchaeota archaeon]
MYKNSPPSNFESYITEFTGNTNDAHNGISLIIDKQGYIHISWDHHGNEIHYARSERPYDITSFSTHIPEALTENKLTYPEFYADRRDNILFFYRTGGSGSGNLVLARYEKGKYKNYRWRKLHKNLINHKVKKTFRNILHPFRLSVNAYWQTTVDKDGGIHLSWVWRDSPNAATNHDICYAYSPDGVAWYKSTGEKYKLPIRVETAEVIVEIPRNSQLINTGTMAIASENRPIIATYWKGKGDNAPQYKIVYRDGTSWRINNIYDRMLDFSLSGFGSLKIPISRPRVLVDDKDYIYCIYRDDEKDGRIAVSICKNLWNDHPKWNHFYLTKNDVGKWEPSIDMYLWETKRKIHLFVQKVEQLDHDQLYNRGNHNYVETPVYIVEWNPQ